MALCRVQADFKRLLMKNSTWHCCYMTMNWIPVEHCFKMMSNEHQCVSNYRQLKCLFCSLYRQQNESSKTPITGFLWGESTGKRWIPLTKGQFCDMSFMLNEAIVHKVSSASCWLFTQYMVECTILFHSCVAIQGSRCACIDNNYVHQYTQHWHTCLYNMALWPGWN